MAMNEDKLYECFQCKGQVAYVESFFNAYYCSECLFKEQQQTDYNDIFFSFNKEFEL